MMSFIRIEAEQKKRFLKWCKEQGVDPRVHLHYAIEQSIYNCDCGLNWGHTGKHAPKP